MRNLTSRRLSTVLASAALFVGVAAPANAGQNGTTSFTPPIGTDKGSLDRALGSTKGSVIDATQTLVFSGDAYVNEMG